MVVDTTKIVKVEDTVKNHEYPEYGINLISVNWVISHVVEPQIVKFCVDNNLVIRANSRDIKRIIGHFLAESVLKVCKEHMNTKNILNYTSLTLCLLDTTMHDVVDRCVRQFLKKFGFCSVDYSNIVDALSLEQLYKLKALVDNCHIKTKTLDKLKKYLSSNHFVKLHQDVRTDIVLRRVLAK